MTTLSASPAAIAAAGGRPARAPNTMTIVLPAKPPALHKGVLRATAKGLKATVVLDPAPLSGLTVPAGTKQVEFEISVAGRTVRGAFNAKSLRRCVAAIAEHGAENVAIVAQGSATSSTRPGSAGSSRDRGR